MKNFCKGYLSHVRKFHQEEPFDFLLYRPIAYCIVSVVQKFPVTPNHFSLLALISAWIGSYFILEKSFLAGIFIILFSVFDCCDGMIARIKKNGSPFGEQIDMFVDLLANIAIYFSLMKVANNLNIPLFAGISIFIHATIFHYYKRLYLDYLQNNPMGRFLHLKKMQDLYHQLKTSHEKPFFTLLLKWYLAFSEGQKSIDQVPVFDGARYTDKNRKILPLWGVLAGSTHLTILSFALLVSDISYYYNYVLYFAPVWLVVVGLYQWNTNRQLVMA